MKTIKNRAALCFSSLACVAMLVACSFDNDPSRIFAVEVGNPLDTTPGKPAQPRPLRLVQVDFQTADLGEIDQIDFSVQNVSLVLLASSGKEVVVESSNLTPGSQLTLIPESNHAVYFSVPSAALENNPQLKIQLKFVGDNPGLVKVESQAFAIEPQTEPLHLTLTSASEARVSGQALVFSKSINKESLFSAPVAGAPEATSPTAGSKGDTQIPVSTGSRVYRLKGS